MYNANNNRPGWPSKQSALNEYEKVIYYNGLYVLVADILSFQTNQPPRKGIATTSLLKRSAFTFPTLIGVTL